MPSCPAHTPAELDAITARAYQFFLARQGAVGNALDDWLRAEAEVRHELEQCRLFQEELRVVLDSWPAVEHASEFQSQIDVSSLASFAVQILLDRSHLELAGAHAGFAEGILPC